MRCKGWSVAGLTVGLVGLALLSGLGGRETPGLWAWAPMPASAAAPTGGYAALAGDLSTQDALTTTSYYQWTLLDLPTGITTSTVSSFSVNPVDAYSAFLTTWGGAYKTGDAGQTWTVVATATLSYPSAVVFAPGNPQRLYAPSWGGLYRSDDGGGSWNRLSAPPTNCGLTVAPSNADRLYARSCGWNDGPALYRSDDGGQTWLTPTLAFTYTLASLAVNPQQADGLVAATWDQVFRSADGGQSWTPLSLGAVYAGQLVFEPQAPYRLYLGHWSGLLRSLDAGMTWQDGGLDRGLSVLTVSPWGEGGVLGGDNTAVWRVAASAATWSAAAWDAPVPLEGVWRSDQDPRALYARAESGFWRYARLGSAMANTLFLPLVAHAPAGPDYPAAARQAIDRANVYRARIGVIPLQPHAAIVASTQNHADYFLLNVADTSAWTYGPHGEVDGKPGFTGRWPGDRMKAAGYPWFGGSEVMHYIGEPMAAVDGWMSTIYHRVISLDPGAHYTGYGYGRNAQGAAVDVMDFGSGPTDTGVWSAAQPYPLAYPANGQTDVPYSWGGGESPDPLPPGAAHPVGYPFTLQGVKGTLQVSAAQLRDAAGAVVPTHPSPADCSSFNCYALIAVSPLRANATYTVQASGTVGGVPFSRTWTFSTGASAAREWPAPASLYFMPAAPGAR